LSPGQGIPKKGGQQIFCGLEKLQLKMERINSWKKRRNTFGEQKK
jgi:hypothetical protein